MFALACCDKGVGAMFAPQQQSASDQADNITCADKVLCALLLACMVVSSHSKSGDCLAEALPEFLSYYKQKARLPGVVIPSLKPLMLYMQTRHTIC